MTAGRTTDADTPVETFRRILVGLDDTPEAMDAARQAAVLREPDGDLHLIAAVDAAKASDAVIAPRAVADQMLGGARAALERAVAATRPTSDTLLQGRPSEVLLEHVDLHAVTLLALGRRDERRMPGSPAGGAGTTRGFSIGTVLLRNARCSVFVATRGGRPAPGRIVVGVDGSPSSAGAVQAARRLSERFGATLELVVGLGGKLQDRTAVVEAYPEVVIDARSPVEALVGASQSADLVVVGSRGLHGLQALGSVSERVAHRAHSSVLVVRDGRGSSDRPRGGHDRSGAAAG